jgi:hypothetical protein
MARLNYYKLQAIWHGEITINYRPYGTVKLMAHLIEDQMQLPMFKK